MYPRLIIAAAVMALAPLAAGAQQPDSILVDEYILKQETVEAQVLSVNNRDRTITVRGEKRGESRTFTVAEGARISVEGREARLRDLRRGDRVMLRMTPQAERVAIQGIRVPQPTVSLAERRAQPAAAVSLPSVLPSTASVWPLVLATGTLGVLGAVVLRLRRRRS